MTGLSSENMAVKRQQLMSALELAQKTTDAAGAPVLDVRPIAKKLLETYGLDLDGELSYEELQQLLADFKKVQESLQAQGVTPP